MPLITALDPHGRRFPITKLDAHVHDVRHLAVSVFVFSGGRLLVQRRAAGKYHSGGLWANTCCSHPLWGENVADCAARRVFEELGCRPALRPFGLIDYRADVGAPPPGLGVDIERLWENESAHCFVGYADEHALELAPDPSEVSATSWIDLVTLATDAKRRPSRYAPWLVIYLEHHLALLRGVAVGTARAGASVAAERRGGGVQAGRTRTRPLGR